MPIPQYRSRLHLDSRSHNSYVLLGVDQAMISILSIDDDVDSSRKTCAGRVFFECDGASSQISRVLRNSKDSLVPSSSPSEPHRCRRPPPPSGQAPPALSPSSLLRMVARFENVIPESPEVLFPPLLRDLLHLPRREAEARHPVQVAPQPLLPPARCDGHDALVNDPP